MIYLLVSYLLALAAGLIAWYRRAARKAEAARAQEEHRADVAVATHTADRAVEARKVEAHERAEAAIPAPDVTRDPAVVVGEIDDAFRGTLPRVVDAETQRRAAERVRARIAAPRRR